MAMHGILRTVAGLHTWRTGPAGVPSAHTRCRTCSADQGSSAHMLPLRTGG